MCVCTVQRICERTFKKTYQYMQAAKMVSVVTLPLQQLNPDAGSCKTKRGRCVPLCTFPHTHTFVQPYHSHSTLPVLLSHRVSGTDILVRCLKLLKPYKRNQVNDDDDDYENNDEDGDAPVKRNVQAEARDIERDLLAQAYEIGQFIITDCRIL